MYGKLFKNSNVTKKVRKILLKLYSLTGGSLWVAWYLFNWPLGDCQNSLGVLPGCIFVFRSSSYLVNAKRSQTGNAHEQMPKKNYLFIQHIFIRALYVL